jgi:hypothetical protein
LKTCFDLKNGNKMVVFVASQANFSLKYGHL